ncbi:hypothetical protein EDC96DRAFT_568184 [Choanephora cucurbitarum]|nr:hypothetical protein EDC96DRAFT_568184 [Choanephora cucurbitarum]
MMGKEALRAFYNSFKADIYTGLDDFNMETLIPISTYLMEYRNNGNRIKLDAEMTAIQLKASKAMQNVVQVLKSLSIQYDDCFAYNANVREDNSCKESYRADYKIDYYEDGQKKVM